MLMNQVLPGVPLEMEAHVLLPSTITPPQAEPPRTERDYPGLQSLSPRSIY